MTPSDEHHWFRRQMLAREAGLLEDGEGSRFQRHLTACPDCRQRWEEFILSRPGSEADGLEREEFQEADAHIPGGILAAWDRTGPALQGLERDMVRRHLDRCRQCQEDLRLLGFEPYLKSAVQGRSEVEVRPLPHPGWPWKLWLVTGWAGTATAVVVALLLRPSATPGPGGMERSGALPWVAPEVVRGNQTPARVEIEADQRGLILAVRVPGGASSREPAEIEVIGPGEERLASYSVRPTDLERGRIMVILDSPRPFRPGIYRVIFRQAEMTPPSAGPVETEFELLVRPAP